MSIVIIRSRDAGVHIGEVESIEGTTVKLKNAKRLWRWRGANTLNEVASKGVEKDFTRISEPVSAITIMSVCEVIECTETAINTFTSRWG